MSRQRMAVFVLVALWLLLRGYLLLTYNPAQEDWAYGDETSFVGFASWCIAHGGFSLAAIQSETHGAMLLLGYGALLPLLISPVLLSLKLTVMSWHFVALLLWAIVIYSITDYRGLIAYLLLSACAPPGISRLEITALGTHSTAVLPLAITALFILMYLKSSGDLRQCVWIFLAGLSTGLGFWCTYLYLPASAAMLLALFIYERPSLKKAAIFLCALIVGLIPWFLITLPMEGLGVQAQQIRTPLDGLIGFSGTLQRIATLLMETPGLFKLPNYFPWNIMSVMLAVLLAILPFVLWIKCRNQKGECRVFAMGFMLWPILTLLAIAFAGLSVEPDYGGANFSSHRYLFNVYNGWILAASMLAALYEWRWTPALTMIVCAILFAGNVSGTMPHIQGKVVDYPGIRFTRLPYVLEHFGGMNAEDQRRFYETLSERARREAYGSIGTRILADPNDLRAPFWFDRIFHDKSAYNREFREWIDIFFAAAGQALITPYALLRTQGNLSPEYRLIIYENHYALVEKLKNAKTHSQSFEAALAAGWVPERLRKTHDYSDWSRHKAVKAQAAGLAVGWRNGLQERDLTTMAAVSAELAEEAGALWEIMAVDRQFNDGLAAELIDKAREDFLNRIMRRRHVMQGMQDMQAVLSGYHPAATEDELR